MKPSAQPLAPAMTPTPKPAIGLPTAPLVAWNGWFSVTIGAVSVIAIALVAITEVTRPGKPEGAIADALSGFANPLIWLIGVSIMISRGIIKTGLGARIGYLFIAVWGKKTIGIAYSLALSELILAPVTPSNTARGGGIIHPIMRAIAGDGTGDGTDTAPGGVAA